jgi:hypothetical protein
MKVVKVTNLFFFIKFSENQTDWGVLLGFQELSWINQNTGSDLNSESGDGFQADAAKWSAWRDSDGHTWQWWTHEGHVTLREQEYWNIETMTFNNSIVQVDRVKLVCMMEYKNGNRFNTTLWPSNTRLWTAYLPPSVFVRVELHKL